jgi:hypothetical protein
MSSDSESENSSAKLHQGRKVVLVCLLEKVGRTVFMVKFHALQHLQRLLYTL